MLGPSFIAGVKSASGSIYVSAGKAAAAGTGIETGIDFMALTLDTMDLAHNWDSEAMKRVVGDVLDILSGPNPISELSLANRPNRGPRLLPAPKQRIKADPHGNTAIEIGGKTRGGLPGPTVDDRTGHEVGRFPVDPRGNSNDRT